MTRTITVISGGLGQPSSTRLLADRLAEATASHLRAAGIEPRIDVVELREHAHEITDNLITGFPGTGLRAVLDGVARSDGLIVVSPIFNASYSGLFKSFFDVINQDALAGKPVLLGATGGTERHSLALEHALRPMFAYLRAVVAPTAVYAASSDWGSTGAGDFGARVERAGGEFAALVKANEPVTETGPFDGFVPFDQLLRAD